MEKSLPIDASHNYVRMALPLMAKYNVPITPKNYAVWYRHVSGQDPSLSAVLQEMIDNERVFTEEINETLYWQYCAGRDEKALKTIRESIQTILVTIINEVVDMSGQTQQYETVVFSSVARLSEDVSAEEIGNIVNEIIDETKEMVKVGKSLQKRLEKTHADLEKVKKEFEQVKIESLSDFLTGVPNRKSFDETLTKMTHQADIETSELSLLLIDIDHFKAFNDRHGHIVGDEVLKFVANKAKSILKGRDFLARFGGEEFAVILPETSLSGAKAAAENIQNFFAKAKLKSKVTANDLGTLTLSIGVACFRRGERLEALVQRADQALYFAKTNGRNRVATEADVGGGSDSN